MKGSIPFHPAAPILALALLTLPACTGDGVPQEEYDAALDSTRKLQMQVEDLESQLEDAKKETAETPVKTDGEDLEKQLDEQLEEIEAQQKELDKIKEEFRVYKSKYRITAREGWIDKKIAKLTTTEGEVFEGVIVKDVTAVGLRVMHDGGTGRIRFENLDKQLQDELGYDKEEADQILAKEMAEREAAREVAREAAAVAAANNTPTPKEKKAMSVASIEREMGKLNDWLRRANLQYQATKREASSLAAKARYAKSRGRVSYFGPKADKMNAAAARINNEIRRARSDLSALRSKLRAAKR